MARPKLPPLQSQLPPRPPRRKTRLAGVVLVGYQGIAQMCSCSETTAKRLTKMPGFPPPCYLFSLKRWRKSAVARWAETFGPTEAGGK